MTVAGFRRAVFLDKDGTLVEDVPYNVDPARIRLLPGVAEGLAALHAAGYLLVVVSNQPGVALGLFERAALRNVEKRLALLFAEAGAALAAFHACPHHPRGNVLRYTGPCACRKPAAGLLLRAARDHDIALADSWMVGDILDDVEAGNRAGCRTVLVNCGGETEWAWNSRRVPDVITSDFRGATAAVLRHGSAETNAGRRGACHA